VKLVDTRDLKSLASNSVPVQVRLRVPYIKKASKQLEAFFLCVIFLGNNFLVDYSISSSYMTSVRYKR